jgi:site-specific recombinase XerD
MGEYWELKITLPNGENQKAVNEYLFMLKNRQWKKVSIDAYRNVLQSFFQDIEVHFSALNMQDVERWLEKKRKSNNQKSTIYLLYALRSFFSYCVENGFLEKHPIPDKRVKENGKKYWELQIQLTNKQNHKVINDYLMSLKIANYSNESITIYRYFLQKFFKEREELFSSFTSNEIQQWFIQHEKGFKEITLRGHLTILSSFYNFCVEEGYIEKSPIKSRMYPRIIKPIPKYLDKEEIAKVRQISENTLIRNRSIFEFLISSGCRISELHLLDRSKVDLEKKLWSNHSNKPTNNLLKTLLYVLRK